MAQATVTATSGFAGQVKSVFEAAYPEGYVDVSKGYRRNVHVVVVSRAFDGMTEREKHDAVWDLARERFGKDTQRISILLAYSPDELKG